jgi:hypothetical protein
LESVALSGVDRSALLRLPRDRARLRRWRCPGMSSELIADIAAEMTAALVCP